MSIIICLLLSTTHSLTLFSSPSFLFFPRINAAGAVAFADALKINTSIVYVGLYHNTISDEGAISLADALKRNSTVKNINLYNNEIGVRGVSALAGALKTNTSLTDISLSSNAIGDDGASMVVDALQVNTSVTSLDVAGNDISESNVAKIDDLLDRNKRLSRLFLFDARHTLSSVLCGDECGVVWQYFVDEVGSTGAGDTTDGVGAAVNIESLRAEFATVVDERARRVAVAGGGRGFERAVKRRRSA
jgi:Ran GTPase-activating protein (RanGAP) involved in mRNA processing and transport